MPMTAKSQSMRSPLAVTTVSTRPFPSNDASPSPNRQVTP